MSSRNVVALSSPAAEAICLSRVLRRSDITLRIRHWDYESEAWARRFFENWRASLKWQRLKPYEKFAEMIDRHWDGIAGYCKPENKVSLGFVEGLNNKMVIVPQKPLKLGQFWAAINRTRVRWRQVAVAVNLTPSALHTFWMVSKRGWASGRRAL